MAGHKTLINRTGSELKVVLIVRKGDHPSATAGTVDVTLGAAPVGESGAEDSSIQKISYGNDIDIFLNGIEAAMKTGGQEVAQRRIVADRDSKLDRILNTHDTIDFRYDGQNLLFSACNADEVEHPLSDVE